MRLVQNPQLEFGHVDISRIDLDPKSRDDIPQILKGLQYIYVNRTLREKIFALLEKFILPKIDKQNGRPGMELWKIFVLGVLRLDLNCDYDRIQELANHHETIRQMLGHSDWYDKYKYQLQTVKDNVSLLTPELLDNINQLVVNAGHVLVKKKEKEALRGRCDSFVLETNVHYPTDINLLFDAMRKTIELTARFYDKQALSDWRQSEYNIRHLKRLMRTAQSKKRSKGKTPEQKQKCERHLQQAHRDYIVVAGRYLEKSKLSLKVLEKQTREISDLLALDTIKGYISHAERQIDQIRRRVLEKEAIPHAEKVFSIFEPHTEWISKGKAGVPQELGLRVCILEDQYQFLLHYQVMEKQTDEKVAAPIVQETKQRFPQLNVVSFDTGFHSPENQETLSKTLKVVALPRKGKLSQKALTIEKSEPFRSARRKHPAVESAINALEVHGLDRCLDHGITGFKRYVALAIVARNIQIIGAILQKQERKRLARTNNKYYNRDGTLKLLA